MLKIGICGTQSVGKTLLVKALGELPEFKDYTTFVERSAYLSSLGIPLNNKSTYEGQLIFLAERASELLCEGMIADRTIIDVIAFTKKSKKIDSAYLGKIFETAAMPLLNRYDIIFYIPIRKEIEVENNGVREVDLKFREEIDTEIRNIIFENEVSFKIPFVKIEKLSIEDRIEEVLNALKNKNLEIIDKEEN